MSDKIALVSCSGLSPLGLVVRAASVELALENENIVAACITEYSAQQKNYKNVDVVKNISADIIVKTYDLNPLDAVRLDEDGEKSVDVLKKYILNELENI